MKINKFLLVFILIIAQIGYASCPKNVVYLKQKEPAPCTGFLFSPEKEQELRLHNEERKLLLQINHLQKITIETSEERLQNFQKYSLELETEIQRREEISFWKSALFFSLGAVITGFIASNVNR